MSNIVELEDLALLGYKSELERNVYASGEERLYHLEFLLKALKKHDTKQRTAQIVTAAEVMQKTANGLYSEDGMTSPTLKANYAKALELLQPMLSEMPTIGELRQRFTAERA